MHKPPHNKKTPPPDPPRPKEIRSSNPGNTLKRRDTMIVESTGSIPYKSILLKRFKTNKELEKHYNIRIFGPDFPLIPEYMITAEGEWDDIARFEKDKLTLEK
jgi:hypothetical protein